MARKKEEITPETTFTAVVYGDGACGPGNPGFYGSGIHGYIFREEDIDVKHNDKAPGNNNITTMGYDNKPINNNKSIKPVKPFMYVNGMICFGYDIGTNNVAEIEAAIRTIRCMVDHVYTINNIIFKTDSAYTIGIFHKLMNKEELDYNHTEIPNLKNAEYYDIIDKLLTELKDKNIAFSIKKVKGHSDNLGNNISDRLAVTARLNGAKGVEGEYIKFYDGAKYWKPNITKHPFLRVNQLFYTHYDRKVLGNNKYIIMDYDTDIEIGKKTHGAMFGIIELNKENAKEIEKMINIDRDNMIGLSILSGIDLSTYYSQTHLVYRELCGGLVYTSKKNHIEVLATDPIISPVYPQGLAKASLDKALTLDDTLYNYKDYKAGKLLDTDELFYVDITEEIYDLSGKKPKIKLDTTEKLLKINLNLLGQDKVLTIPLKRELVDRNTLKQLESDIEKVYIEVTVVNDKTIRYNTIIDANGEIGVYTNFYTANVIL